MSNEEYLSYGNFPRRLNTEEINNPYLAITEFFSYNSLPECRENLRNWFQAALVDRSMSETGNPANLFSFYEQVEKLIEATPLIKDAEIVKLT